MDDPFVIEYEASELKIAVEFLTNWLPFFTRDLCDGCAANLRDRIHALDLGVVDHSRGEEGDAMDRSDTQPASLGSIENDETDAVASEPASPSPRIQPASRGSIENDDADVMESELVSPSPRIQPASLGSVENDEADAVASELAPPSLRIWMLWADMAQEDEDELGVEAEEVKGRLGATAEEAQEKGKLVLEKEKEKKLVLSREQWKHIRLMSVGRQKDFICFERVNGKLVNILDGLELHTGVFSVADQKRIVDFAYGLQEKGRSNQLGVGRRKSGTT